MSYTAKYASSFYGPFRGPLIQHLNLVIKKLIKWIIQIQKKQKRSLLDQEEGADILMVKPLALFGCYFETEKCESPPIAAYNVSGEYAMIKAAEKGWLEGEKVMVSL